jgi:acetyl esterase/lipase
MNFRPHAPSFATVSRRAVTNQIWAGLGLILLGGLGLAGMRVATAKGSVGMLDATDRLLAGGDGAIRLAEAAQFGPEPEQRLQLFMPTDPALDPAITGQALPLVMFIHGGGWVTGDPYDYRFIARLLAPAGHAVVLAGYRLDRAGRYPAMLEDGAAALRWIAEHAPAQGGDTARIVLMGHSAGAYNAVMLGLEARWLAQTGLSPRAICGVVGLAGPYDFLPFDNPGTIATFGHVVDQLQTQPIAHVRGDAPPLLLIHGADDQRVRPRNSLSLARAMAGCGGRSETHVITGVGHEGLIMRFARPFSRDRRALGHVLEFLARVTGIPASAPVQALEA